MKRFACLRLPRWPIQRLIVERPEWRGRPILVRRRDARRGELVVECSTAARQAGVIIDMPMSEATLLCPNAEIPVHDPAADLIALGKLAEYCERLSPLVGWHTITPKVTVPWFGEAPAHLFLDLTTIGVLFGGEEKLAERIIAGCQSVGYMVCLAVAETLGAAWALASETEWSRRATMASPAVGLADSTHPTQSDHRLSRRVGRVCETHQSDSYESLPIIPHGELEAALRPLPISQLRLPDDDVDTLARLGVLTIEQLLRLTRTGLAERLSRQVLLRLDQALGTVGEVIVPHRPAPKYQANFWLEAASGQRDTIDWLVEKLIERIAGELQSQGEGAVVVTGHFECDGGAVVPFEIGLFRPSACVQHIMKLLRLQTERLKLPAPVTSIRLHAERTAPLEERQGELFADAAENAGPERAALFERLSGRMGSAAVVRAVRQADPLPERAYRYVPVVGQKLRTKRRPAVEPAAGSGDPAAAQGDPTAAHVAVSERPLRLLVIPASIDAISVVPDGPPVSFHWQRTLHTIARYWGPERIETGWWRQGTVRRDYYRVETEAGRRFWMFRDLWDGGWYVHGGS